MTSGYGILRAANNGGLRREHDFYPTEPEPTLALLPYLRDWPREAWECACGDGGIGLVLELAGFRVVGTDLVDRGYGQGGVDFLRTTELRAPAIITNPPFGNLAPAFISHALDLGVPYMAILLNVNFWCAAARTPTWKRRRPAWRLDLTWRPDFTGSGSPYFNCCWTIWTPESAPYTKYDRLDAPPASRILPALIEQRRRAGLVARITSGLRK